MIEIFEAWPLLLLAACGLFGLIVGSFINVVAYRLPIMMELRWREERDSTEATDGHVPVPSHIDAQSFNLSWPPSACPHCNAKIKAHQNIPVLSYLWLRGRCSNCQRTISKRYPMVEIIVGIASVLVAWRFGASWACVAALGLTWTLIAASLIDIDHYLLPDSLTLPLLWSGLLISLFFIDGNPIFTDIRSSVIGAAAGYLSLWSVYHLFKLITGKEGMGYGDFKLLAALGAWLGWQMLPLIITVSAAVGTVVGLVGLFVQGKSRHTPIPFGPYLAAAGWVALIWGDRLLELYLSVML